MLDIKYICDNPDQLAKLAKQRGLTLNIDDLIKQHETLKVHQEKLQTLQEQRNTIAQEIALAKRQKSDSHALEEKGVKIRQEISQQEALANEHKQLLEKALLELPNLLHQDVPSGDGETDNVCLKTWGKKPAFSFPVKDHTVLGEALGGMDFNKASQMSGSRFVVLKGSLAKLERALAQFMLDLHTQAFNYQEVSVPLLVKSDALYATGQLPKFGEESFKTTDERWLIPTAEVPLTNLANNEIFAQEALPLRYVAHTPCFRSEAGAAGKDTKGMIRLHQFNKVELVSFTTPDNAEEEHQYMLAAAEQVLIKLEIPFRTMLLCDADTGFHSFKTYDIEAWIPSQNAYREISSCSQFATYQARRLKARYRPLSEGKKQKPQYLNTLNGSGLAVGRTLVALLENYQNEDGSVTIPTVLRGYMGGQEKLVKE